MTQPHQIDREAVAALIERLRENLSDSAPSRLVCVESADVQSALDTIEALSRPMEAVAWREKVARIIDPDGWNTRDRQNREIDKNLASGFMTEAEAERARPSTGMYSQRSLAKADAILQALAVIPTYGGGND